MSNKKTVITLDQPTRPKGDLIEVPPIGLIENGGSVELEGLEDEQAAILAGAYGVKIKHGGKNVEPADNSEAPEAFAYVDPEVASGAVDASDTVEPVQTNFSGGGDEA